MKSRSQNGVTFIELILVVAIILTIGIMSTAFYSRFLTQNSVDNVTDQFAGQLRKAQIYTMMGKQSGGVWGVNYSSNRITLFQGNSYATRNTALDETFTVNANITVSGITDVTFARLTGIPSSSPTITVAGNNSQNILTVNSMGVVSR